MKIGPKYKICKRLGSGVFEKCQTQRYTLSEARRGRTMKRRKVLSDFGRQLLEKQRLRYTYGLSEKQLVRYVKEATSKEGNPTEALLFAIESRLDNVVYRTGLASTRRFARQIVSHGHIVVNGRKTTVPSHRLKDGDVFAIRDGSKSKTLFANLFELLEKHTTPNWLSFDSKKMEGKVIAKPSVPMTELFFNTSEVLEYYTR